VFSKTGSARVTNILVADDNPVTLRFFAEALTQLGFDHALARDGTEACALASQTAFDILLFDARMPSLDGCAALARIRSETGASQNAIAIATTADAGDATREALLAAGFIDVIPKPVGIDALRAALARHSGATIAPVAAAAVATSETDALDDSSALLAVGGDASILAALRGLLIGELDALPAEIAEIASRNDVTALRDRLHRLDASAGFCGARGLASAVSRLRAALDDSDAWPNQAAHEFLVACAHVRDRLATTAAI
jgi:CheY-like chemotaxis protein